MRQGRRAARAGESAPFPPPPLSPSFCYHRKGTGTHDPVSGRASVGRFLSRSSLPPIAPPAHFFAFADGRARPPPFRVLPFPSLVSCVFARAWGAKGGRMAPQGGNCHRLAPRSISSAAVYCLAPATHPLPPGRPEAEGRASPPSLPALGWRSLRAKWAVSKRARWGVSPLSRCAPQRDGGPPLAAALAAAASWDLVPSRASGVTRVPSHPPCHSSSLILAHTHTPSHPS